MMLPIIFRRHSNRYVSGRNSYTPGRRSKRRGGWGRFVLMLVLLAVLADGAWMAWRRIPLTEDEQRIAMARVVVQTRYVVSTDTVDLISFADTKADTLLFGIDQVNTDTVVAQWVRDRERVPFSGVDLLIEKMDTAEVATLDHDKLTTLLRRQNEMCEREEARELQHKDDVDYYLRTHSPADNGYDIVLRYENHHIKQRLATLAKEKAMLAKALDGRPLSIRLDRRYLLLVDSVTADTLAADSAQTRTAVAQTDGGAAPRQVECTPKLTTKYMIRLDPAEDASPHKWWQRLPKFSEAMGNIERHTPRHAPLLSAIDLLGQYDGGRDSLAMPHGYGTFFGQDGSFYEGQWKHGKRHGVGFGVLPGKGTRLGEWADNIYKGERISYTPERIYGIDISRHQHEKGRKRYSINWPKLRITSLGTKSKKTIEGEVNYPVSFIFIKCTEGVTVYNKYFAADYAAARKHGYRTGAYHFFSIHTSGNKQAQNFLKRSRYNKGDLPPVLDLEPTDGQIRQAGGIQKLFTEVRHWLNAVEKSRGVRPILYISQRFANKYLPLAPDLLKGYDVWIARYGEYKPDVRLQYWQLAADGRVNGIHGDVDINVYNGFDF